MSPNSLISTFRYSNLDTQVLTAKYSAVIIKQLQGKLFLIKLIKHKTVCIESIKDKALKMFADCAPKLPASVKPSQVYI